MNDPWEEIENELKNLRPSAPRERVTQRIGLELDATETRASRGLWPWLGWRWVAWATVGACCLGGAVAWHGWQWATPSRVATRPLAAPPSATAVVIPHYQPIKTANYVVEAEDEGVVYASANLPLRQIRCQVVATSAWRNAKDNSTVEVWVPREEVMLIPMRVY